MPNAEQRYLESRAGAPELTLQQIFDDVWEYFSKEGAKLGVHSTGQVSKCAYRTPDGASCGVGCLLTEEEAHSYFWAVHNAEIADVDVGDMPVRLRTDRADEFLMDLQQAHDNAEDVEDFLRGLNQLALEWELLVPAQP